jgi:pyrimidine-nucleoside phosphorylase
MTPQDIIALKRDGEPIPAADLRAFVLDYSLGDVPDYQMAAFAMATCVNGMSFEETSALTESMKDSGEILNFGDLSRIAVDKHSTGGIGDKVSLVLAPLAAACGVLVPMISGRGLGLTGGTLDKLESIPGYRTDLSSAELRQVVNDCGCAITGQTNRLAPADKKLYALRDVTGTVPSIPLITASILCKKLAAGVQALVLDVKCGSGSFMKTEDEARELAETMVAVGTRSGCRVEALVTEMNRPLGRTAGNALEVFEVVRTLRGEGPPDLVEITYALGTRMLALAKIGTDDDDRRAILATALDSGRAFEVFIQMVELQGGNPSYVESPDKLPSAKIVERLLSQNSGYVTAVDADKVGRAAFILGAGRRSREDNIDFAVGVSDLKQVGEAVSKGDSLAHIHANATEHLDEARTLLASSFILDSSYSKPAALIKEQITNSNL